LKPNEANLVKNLRPAKDLSETSRFQALNFQEETLKGMIPAALKVSRDLVPPGHRRSQSLKAQSHSSGSPQQAQAQLAAQTVTESIRRQPSTQGHLFHDQLSLLSLPAGIA